MHSSLGVLPTSQQMVSYGISSQTWISSFIPVPGAQCEPALICEENRTPLADLLILVLSGKC